MNTNINQENFTDKDYEELKQMAKNDLGTQIVELNEKESKTFKKLDGLIMKYWDVKKQSLEDLGEKIIKSTNLEGYSNYIDDEDLANILQTKKAIEVIDSILDDLTSLKNILTE